MRLAWIAWLSVLGASRAARHTQNLLVQFDFTRAECEAGRFADSQSTSYVGALLRENPPPWLRLAKNGSPYYEAILQIKTERGDETPTHRAGAPKAEPAPTLQDLFERP